MVTAKDQNWITLGRCRREYKSIRYEHGRITKKLKEQCDLLNVTIDLEAISEVTNPEESGGEA